MVTPGGHGEASVGTAATADAGYRGAPRQSLGDHPAEAAPDSDREAAAGPEAVGRFVEDLDALRRQIGLLISARIDQAKLSLRRALLLCLLAAVAVVGILALAASAVVLLVVGLAGGLAHWIGGPPWLGQLLTALGLIGGGAALGWLLIGIWRKRSLKNTLRRYGKRDDQPAAG